jgi:hypothetical protein
MDLKERAEDLARHRKICQTAISRELKSIGLELRTCGTKNPLLPDDSVSQETGTWAIESVKTKPSRWLVQFSDKGPSIKATPAEKSGDTSRIGYFNLRTNTVAAVGIRILPVVERSGGIFEVLQQFEWFMVPIFAEPLEAGTSGDAFDFNVESGEISRQGTVLPVERILIVCLADPDELVTGGNKPFKDYTKALKKMLLSSTEITEENMGV